MTSSKKILTGVAAAFFTGAGVLHFLSPGPYLRIMPPYVPWHLPMVYISGAAEIAGGLGLLVPKLRRAAAWGLVALLIAVFPANVYMAQSQLTSESSALAKTLLLGRLPLQALLIWWVLAIRG